MCRTRVDRSNQRQACNLREVPPVQYGPSRFHGVICSAVALTLSRIAFTVNKICKYRADGGQIHFWSNRDRKPTRNRLSLNVRALLTGKNRGNPRVMQKVKCILRAGKAVLAGPDSCPTKVPSRGCRGRKEAAPARWEISAGGHAAAHRTLAGVSAARGLRCRARLRFAMDMLQPARTGVWQLPWPGLVRVTCAAGPHGLSLGGQWSLPASGVSGANRLNRIQS